MKKVMIATFLIATSAVSTWASAQNGNGPWRCGSTYSDQPCSGGKAVNASDARSDADRRAADAATRRMEQRGDQLERSRLRQEHDVAERDRRAVADARRFQMAQRKLELAEQAAKSRERKAATEPRKQSKTFKSGGSKSAS